MINMLSDSRRKKLELLLRSSEKVAMATAQDMLRSAAHASPGPAGASPPAPAALALTSACPGQELILPPSSGGGRYWLVRRTLAEIAPDCLHVARQFTAVMRGARQRFDELDASAELCKVSAMSAQDLLFLDIETCGLSGCAIFLVGVMRAQGQELVFRQFFARDYSEEPAILRAFLEELDASSALVTFNGKAFDMNMIRERAAFHGLALPDREPPHMDLLHESRKRWRGRLPNCKLQTLERFLCHRHRVGDIPGAAIPDAYHQFVKTSDARRVADILHHNLLDLLTMAELVTAVLTGSDGNGDF